MYPGVLPAAPGRLVGGNHLFIEQPGLDLLLDILRPRRRPALSCSSKHHPTYRSSPVIRDRTLLIVSKEHVQQLYIATGRSLMRLP